MIREVMLKKDHAPTSGLDHDPFNPAGIGRQLESKTESQQ
jgi:hypothetical protein